jgi:hypothetical protein
MMPGFSESTRSRTTLALAMLESCLRNMQISLVLMRSRRKTYLEAFYRTRLSGVVEFVVDPGDDLLLDHGVVTVGQLRQDGQGVGAHQLPDQRCNFIKFTR